MGSVAEEKTSVYDDIVQRVFSGDVAPGTRLVERNLAGELGVSRIPVREALARMVARGILVSGRKHQGVRMRDYSSEEIQQLYEYREILESGVFKAAARSATESDLARIEAICDRMEANGADMDKYDWSVAASLERRFHEAIAEAGHNERLVQAVRALLTECYYLFYVLPSRQAERSIWGTETAEQLQHIIRSHRDVLEMVREDKPEEAEKIARIFMLKCRDEIIRWMSTCNSKA